VHSEQANLQSYLVPKNAKNKRKSSNLAMAGLHTTTPATGDDRSRPALDAAAPSNVLVLGPSPPDAWYEAGCLRSLPASGRLIGDRASGRLIGDRELGRTGGRMEAHRDGDPGEESGGVGLVLLTLMHRRPRRLLLLATAPPPPPPPAKLCLHGG
jgi:hypothetical protein